MATLADIAMRVQQRLEEVTGPPGVFWQYQTEIIPAVVEAMNEASLLTGVVQVPQTALYTIPPDATYLSMPANAVALLRVQAQLPIQKTDIYSLDQLIPGWQTVGGSAANPPVQQIQYWFPVGLTTWGIYPQMSAPIDVQLTYLAYPTPSAPPYSGTSTVPFQQEFQDALEEYAAHILRLKEAGYEFQISQINYQEFLDTMKALSAFQGRRDSLVFTGAVGARVRVNPVEVR